MSAAALGALGLAGVAAALLVPGRSALAQPASARTDRLPAPVLVGVVAGGVGAVLLLGGGHRLVLGLLAVAVGAALLLALRHRRAQARAEDRRDRVLAACESLTAELRAGRPPLAALERSARDWAELAPVVTAARVDADVPAAMRHLAQRPGAGDLVAVAAAWQVATRTGSGLAASLGQVVGGLRERRRTARLVAGELAAARATAKLLAVLPVGVLALGSSLGGDPVGFLLGTTPGLVCLALGLALCGAGWWWLQRLADGVLR